MDPPKKQKKKRSTSRRRKKRIKKQKTPLVEIPLPPPQKIKKKKKHTKKQQTQQVRIKTMKRDAERYALIDLGKNKKGFEEFVLMNLKENKTRKVAISSFDEVSCSCIDFRIRCKKLKISCKHILYVLDRIMKLDMSVVKNLKIKQKDQFYSVFNRIKRKFVAEPDPMFKINENKHIEEDEVCPICYTEFGPDKENIDALQCPDCSNLVHRDCMKFWLENAVRKTCVYCRSSKWSLLKI